MSFLKRLRPANRVAGSEHESGVAPKFPRPKILLIDLPDDCFKLLEKDGFAVSTGSFGNVYEVRQSDEYIPVIPSGGIDDPAEQDIVVVDLQDRCRSNVPLSGKVTSNGELDWWASCSRGIVDPRPRRMVQFASAFGQVLDAGGLFVVFLEPRIWPAYQEAFFYSGRFIPGTPIKVSTWDFVWPMQHVHCNYEDRGAEIYSDSSDGLASVISRHLDGSRYSCSISVSADNKRALLYGSLLRNRYGRSVGGLILTCPEEGPRSAVLLLPQIARKAELMRDLLQDEFPRMRPELFPHVEKPKWADNPPYESRRVGELTAEIRTVREAAQRRVETLEAEIQAERECTQYLKALLTEQKGELVAAVKQALETLGFAKVRTMDDEDDSADRLREDLRIEDGKPLLLVEVKGVKDTPSDTDALRASQYMAPRMKQLGTLDVAALFIVNHERHIPPLKRKNETLFHNDIIVNSEQHAQGLLTTWDLFRLVRSFERNQWDHSRVRDLFYKAGRIEPIPSAYQYLGRVSRRAPEHGVVGIHLEEGEIHTGDRIAFDLGIEFAELTATSIQQGRQPVERATPPAEVGVKADALLPELREKMRVFVVREGAVQPDRSPDPEL